MHNAEAKFINPHKLYVGSFLPEWLERMPGISDGAKLVYARLCRFAGKDGIAYPKIETLCDALGKQERMIKKYTKELRDAGLIVVERRGMGQSNIYKFVDPFHAKIIINREEQSFPTEGKDITPLMGTTVPHRGEPQFPIEGNHSSPPILRESIEENHIKRINGKESAQAREPNHFDQASEVLKYLNEASGKNFIPNLTNKKYIAERISEGRAVEILKQIIDLKVAQSRRKQKNGQPIFNPTFLRPQTLFSEQNCEKYINEIDEIKSGKSDAFAFEGTHSKQQRRLEALREAGLDPLRMFGYS